MATDGSGERRRTRSIKENFAWNAAFQMLRMLVSLITMPYLARVLGAGALGTYSYTYTIAYWFTLLGLLGLNQYGSREIARTRDDVGKLSATFWSLYFMQVFVVLVSVASYLAVSFFFNREFMALAFVWLIWVAGEAVDFNWFFFGIEEFRITVIRNFVIKIVAVACIFIFVQEESDLGSYCLIQALGFSVSYAILIPFLRARIKWVKPSARAILSHVKPNLLLFAPIVAATMYTQLDKVLLGTMSDMVQVGFFDNSEKLSKVPLGLITALGTVMLPRMSNVLAHGENGKADSYLRKSMWLATVLSFGFMFEIIAVAPEFIPLYFGGEFIPCIITASILSAIVPLVAWSNVIGVQYLLPSGEDGRYTFSVVVGAAVNISVNLALIPILHSNGAAIAIVLAEASVTLTQILMVRRRLPVKEYVIDGLPYLVIGLLMLVVVRCSAAAIGFCGIGGVLAEVLFGLIVYIILSMLWMLVSGDDKINLFKRIVYR